ncbi:deoxyribodipyrimidine photolyase [Thermogutta sp.]|uniref:deoxyribodipyrimidine photolyase n=1 Tax=Thermogutta sp. TaxID=1962930 RepID=UPI00321FFF77
MSLSKNGPKRNEFPRPGHASAVPRERIRLVRDLPIRPGRPVLYWMGVQHRLSWNFALDRALEIAEACHSPHLLLVETLAPFQRLTIRHLHFWWDAVCEHASALSAWGRNFVAGCPRSWEGFLERLVVAASHCAALIVDEFPYHDYRQLLNQLGERAQCRVEAVDSCGLLPLAVHPRCFSTARGFRRVVQELLPHWLRQLPDPRPLSDRWQRTQPIGNEQWWPPVTPEEVPELLAGSSSVDLAWIDHAVPPVRERGGSKAAHARWTYFLAHKIEHYDSQRNHPDAEATSGLSSYLHFGVISPHELVRDIFHLADELGRCKNNYHRLSDAEKHATKNWWGLPSGLAEFLDQLLVWREIGFNFCAFQREYKCWNSLPEWARRTLTKHHSDPRPKTYTEAQLAHSATEDVLWNAAQTELREHGRIHNYLRMLWGKKILEWSPTPESALETMIELNDRYALDGCDPNSYTGICWILGRYDRPWGPERPIFGTVRYMSTASAMRKLRLTAYLQKYGSATGG